MRWEVMVFVLGTDFGIDFKPTELLHLTPVLLNIPQLQCVVLARANCSTRNLESLLEPTLPTYKGPTRVLFENFPVPKNRFWKDLWLCQAQL